MVLQSSVDGHIIMVDPRVISQIISVPVLQQPASLYNEVVLPPSLDDLRDFFQLSLTMRSVQLLSRSVPCLLCTACSPRSSCTIYGLWLGAMTSFWRRHNLFMLSAYACSFVCASIFWGLSWRPMVRAISVFLLTACSLRSFCSQASVSLASPRWRFKIPLASRHWWSPMLSWGETIRMMILYPLLSM